MRGIVLDRVTGKPQGEATLPRSIATVDDWLADIERTEALRRNAKLLERAGEKDYGNTTTTNRYLCYPTGAAGISRASSGVAWTNSAWTEVVPVNTITATFYIAGLTWMWWTPVAAADTTYEIELCLGTGGSGAETEIIVVPASLRVDTAVGPVPSNFVTLPEPRQITANTRVAVRLRYGTAAAVTVSGIKIWYQTA